MTNWVRDIGKVLKVLLLVLALCLSLSACNGSEDGNSDRKLTPLGAIQTDKNANQTIEELAEEHRSCWQTEILKLMYQQMGKMALSMYAQITQGSLAFMMVAFAVWMSFRLMRHLSSFQEENLAETWNEILKQLLLCFVCGMIAESSENIMWLLNKVIFPIYYAFLEFGAEILNVATADTGGNKGDFYFLGELVMVGEKLTCTAGKLVTSDKLTEFPQAPLEMLNCMTCVLDKRLAPGLGVSFSVLWDIGLMAFFLGMCIFLIFLFIRIAFVFYLVDMLFRFTIMIALLPVLIMAYAFKATRGWTTKGFYAIIVSAAYMMFVSIVIAVALLAMEEVMRMKDLGLDFKSISEFKESFKQLGITFLCLMLIGFMLVSTMGITKDLTSQLVGGDADSRFAATGAKAIAMAGKAITLAVLAFLTAGVSKVAMRFATVRNAKAKVSKAWDNSVGRVIGAVGAFSGAGRGGFSGGFKSSYKRGRDGKPKDDEEK